MVYNNNNIYFVIYLSSFPYYLAYTICFCYKAIFCVI